MQIRAEFINFDYPEIVLFIFRPDILLYIISILTRLIEESEKQHSIGCRMISYCIIAG